MQTKTDLEEKKASRVADEQFLMRLKGDCRLTDKERAAWQKTRGLKMEVVSEDQAVRLRLQPDPRGRVVKRYRRGQDEPDVGPKGAHPESAREV